MNSRHLKDNVVSAGNVVLNFSNTIVIRPDVWHAQGAVHKALENAVGQLQTMYKLLYVISKHVIKYLDRKPISKFLKASRLIVSNSKYCKRVYEGLGIPVHEVIYEPTDTTFFRSVTRKTKENYILAYFGKETDYLTIKKVADAGIRIKAFGSKAPTLIPKEVLRHANIEILGFVKNEELVNLYSNALFTIFPFTEEPFGYVPVESMACGTSVLTYNKQEPSETVLNGVTGRLANNDEELIKLAVEIWRNGYPSWMRSKCRERALEFDVKVIADKWPDIIHKLI